MTKLSTERSPSIALTWLERLRWVAVAGQLLAVLVAEMAVGLTVHLPAVFAVVSVTVLTNLALLWSRRRRMVGPSVARVAVTGKGRSISDRLVPAVIVLDVMLLTIMLAFTGGAENPFSMLYLVHVALATVMLGTRGAWAVLFLSALCYGSLTIWWVPFNEDAFSRSVRVGGQWVALLLIGGLIVYFTARVLAALRRRELDLAEAHERALRNEGLTTLAAGAAHELGTPLATINIVVGELEHQTDGDVREDIRLIKSEVDRCRNVIDRMRGEIAEGAALSKRHAEWQDVLAGVQRSLGDRAERLAVVATDVPPIGVQPRVLEQALVIMIRNAFDASPPDAWVTLTAKQVDGTVRLEVRDDGEGMSAEVLRRAAEPFFTTKPPGKGMGLGLFLVRLTAERNDGVLEIDSTPGEGTAVTMRLPLAAGAATRPHVEPPAAGRNAALDESVDQPMNATNGP
ncbi:MAG: ATP-binding protein [Planctomycetota bacterium]